MGAQPKSILAVACQVTPAGSLRDVTARCCGKLALEPGLYQPCTVFLGLKVALCASELHQSATLTGKG